MKLKLEERQSPEGKRWFVTGVFQDGSLLDQDVSIAVSQVRAGDKHQGPVEFYYGAVKKMLASETRELDIPRSLPGYRVS